MGTFEEHVDKKKLPKELRDALPYVQDGRMYWREIQMFVTAFLKLYYQDDEAVLADKEMSGKNGFWDRVNCMPCGDKGDVTSGRAEEGFGYKLPLLREGKGAFQNLVA